MCMVFWFQFLVDIPHHHDCDDDILLLHDEKARNGLLDGLLHKRQDRFTDGSRPGDSALK